MKILAVGDVCGDPGLAFLDKRLKSYKEEAEIDFCVVNGVGTAKFLWMFPSAFSGKHVRYHETDLFRAREAVIRIGTERHVHADGEAGLKASEIRLSVHPEKLRLVVGKRPKVKKVQKHIKKISKYYGSKNWYKDFDDYNNKKIKNIKAGVLSEDGIYNVIMDNKEIAEDLNKLSKKILKEK